MRERRLSDIIGPSPLDLGAAAGSAKAGRPAGALQTLDRGLKALSLIAQHEAGLSVTELAERLGVHRTIAYRIASTLEVHGLLTRSPRGLLHLGAGIVALSARFEPQLREAAQPLLDQLADMTGAAAFLSVPEGPDCVAIMVAEPQNTLLRVAYRIGHRHPLTRGAAGIAILAGRPGSTDDPPAVWQARQDGFSVTRGQLQAGAVGVSCPIHEPHRIAPPFEASIGIVTLGEADVAEMSRIVMGFAIELRSLLLPDR